MAKIRVQTEDVGALIEKINELVENYKKSADGVLGHIESFPWWSGTDKDMFQNKAIAAADEYSKLASSLSIVNQTIGICMSKYESVFEQTKNKSKTI